MQKILFGVVTVLFITACDDNAIVNVYDKTILKTPIPCLKLSVIPETKFLTETMKSLYSFDEQCPYTLDVSYKNSITCNSTSNVQSRSISGFPSAYLSMKVRQGLSVKYSYYIDLKEDVSSKNLEKGFERLKKDLILK